MTREHDPDRDPDRDPAQDIGGNPTDADERLVRELLAAAGRPEPVPDDVAARLDAVLADLVAERASGEAPEGTPSGTAPDAPVEAPAEVLESTPDRLAEPASISDRRAARARRWRGLLVAAALLSVVGVGVGTLTDDVLMGGGDSESAAGGSTADEAPTAGRGSAEERDVSGLPAQELHRDSLTADVEAVQSLARPVPRDGGSWRGACVRPPVERGDEWVPVTLDGEPGLLVLRAPVGGRRTAEVFGCGEPRSRMAQTTVAAR